jgi:F0F1-type ATP synthase membrane subunit a
MLQAPLEQFQILQLIPISILSLDFSVTNFLLINLLALLSLISFIYYNASSNTDLQEVSLFFSPNSWQKAMESISEIIAQLISDVISVGNEKYFPIISVLFNFILFSNLIGLLPYNVQHKYFFRK